ncbi:MAG TPA: FtsX-like permease family protein [Patescibacteria group bacterium]
MSILVHGARNAFRNTIRTFSITLILALSIGLALIMFLAYRTVSARIETVKSTIGNTITVNPAGARGFEGGGEPLTVSQINDLSNLEHVNKVAATLSARMTAGTDTSLVTAIEAGTLGLRQNRFNQRDVPTISPGTQGQTRTFTIPIMVTGIKDTSILTTGSTSVISGNVFNGDSDDNVALLGKSLAEKNGLMTGSTFTAFGTTITVSGIYDAGNQFANSSLYMPLKTTQRLSGQTDEVSVATVSVDSVTNLDATVTAIKNKLGEDKADVTSNEESAKQALSPLENVKNISFYSLIGSLAAGAIITLLTMIMIVRERRKEIGVLKAIGASNIRVVAQFITESLVLTVLGSIVGMILGFFLSNPILSALVANSSTTDGSTAGRMIAGPGGGGFMRISQLGSTVQTNLRDIHSVMSYDILLYGLLAALIIAIIGSALPAWLIAKVRPAEVIRGE